MRSEKMLCGCCNIDSRCSEYIIVIIISSQSHGDLLSADNLCKHLDPDQGQQNFGSDLDSNCLCRPKLFVSYTLFEIVDFEKVSIGQGKHEKYPAGKELSSLRF